MMLARSILFFVSMLWEAQADLISSRVSYPIDSYSSSAYNYSDHGSLGATDLVCLGGVVMMAATFQNRKGREPAESERANLNNIIDCAWRSRGGESSLAKPSRNARVLLMQSIRKDVNELVRLCSRDVGELRSLCAKAGFSTEQTECFVAYVLSLISDDTQTFNDDRLRAPIQSKDDGLGLFSRVRSCFEFGRSGPFSRVRRCFGSAIMR